jgi:hypothetical protein
MTYLEMKMGRPPGVTPYQSQQLLGGATLSDLIRGWHDGLYLETTLGIGQESAPQVVVGKTGMDIGVLAGQVPCGLPHVEFRPAEGRTVAAPYRS